MKTFGAAQKVLDKIDSIDRDSLKKSLKKIGKYVGFYASCFAAGYVYGYVFGTLLNLLLHGMLAVMTPGAALLVILLLYIAGLVALIIWAIPPTINKLSDLWFPPEEGTVRVHLKDGYMDLDLGFLKNVHATASLSPSPAKA